MSAETSEQIQTRELTTKELADIIISNSLPNYSFIKITDRSRFCKIEQKEKAWIVQPYWDRFETVNPKEVVEIEHLDEKTIKIKHTPTSSWTELNLKREGGRKMVLVLLQAGIVDLKD